jgi:hypothetical protein
VEPLRTGLAGHRDSPLHEALSDALATHAGMDNGVQQERMAPAVPGDVGKPDEPLVDVRRDQPRPWLSNASQSWAPLPGQATDRSSLSSAEPTGALSVMVTADLCTGRPYRPWSAIGAVLVGMTRTEAAEMGPERRVLTVTAVQRGPFGRMATSWPGVAGRPPSFAHRGFGCYHPSVKVEG